MKNIFLFILFLSFTIASCNKDAEIIDDNLDSDDIKVLEVDSFVLKSTTILDEVVNGKNLTRILLGNSDDSRTGSSKASFYTQLSLTQNDFDLGANPVLDSIVLIIAQTNSYGALNASFDVSVYELNTTLDDTETYDNNTVLNLNNNIGNQTLSFNSTNSTLRIPLDNSFGNSLISKFGTQTMESSDDFKDYLKGLFITSNATNGDGFLTLSLKHDDTRLAMYYHSDTYTDTSYNFIVDNSDITINQYFNDFSGSEAETQLNLAAENEDVSYLTAMSGIKSKIEFPDFSELRNVIINKAELSFYQLDYASTESMVLPEPDKLFLYVNLNDTSLNFLQDFSISDPEPFGGSKELVEIDGVIVPKYTFNISEYAQSLVSGSAESESLYLTNYSNNEGGRLKLGGGLHSQYPIGLKLLYTKIN